MRDHLDLILFGSPEVRHHGQTVTGFRSSKAQALLYYLAVTSRPHTRATLAGLLWGDQPEAAARASLSKCLSNLRELVGDALLVERQTVAFNREHPYQLDTERFMDAVGQPPTAGTVHSLQAALALYHGDFLEGFYVRDAPDFEQWALVQRAHYREAVVQGLHTLANYADQQGDLPQAITHTRRLLTLEPWREEAHRQLMARLAHSGQRAAALAQFETCRRILAEELAVEPDAETVALVAMIRAGAFDRVTTRLSSPKSRWQGDEVNRMQEHPVTSPMLGTRPPHPVKNNLPVPPTPLIGRERELGELSALLGNPHRRLITITGPGGIGKTRLALAVAERHLANRPEEAGACFVSLAAVDEPQTILPMLLNALALPTEHGQASIEVQKRQILDFLARQQMLLIFDNFEQVMDGRALLLEILSAAPLVQLLVTSRERLHLQNEQIYPIGGLVCPVTIADKGTPALTLFVATAQRTHPHFQPDPQETLALISICQLVVGMPLALELAASWVHILTPSAIAESLRTNLDLLEANVYDLPARHRTMRAAFDATWALLTEGERRIFAQLSLFRGGFTRDAAHQIADATIKQLSALADKSLIDCRQPTDRYNIHELLRQYGAEKLLAMDPSERTRARHLLYYLDLAEDVEPHRIDERASEIEQMAYRQPYKGIIDRQQEITWYDRLERDLDNLRAALQWSITTHRQAALRLAGALGEFWYMRGYYSEGRSWLQRALEQSTDAPSLAQGWALRKAGKLAMAQGDYSQATALFETSLAIYHTLEDDEGIGSSLNFLGVAALYHNDHAKAEQLLAHSLVLRRELSDHADIAASLHNLSIVAMCHHNVPQATAFLDECFAVLGRNGVADAGLIYGTSAGYLKLYQEDAASAVDHFIQTISLALEENDKPAIIHCLEGLAYTCSLYGTTKEGQQQAVRLLSMAETLRMNLGVPRACLHGSLHDKSIYTVHTQISEADFTIAWDEGQQMSVEQAISHSRMVEIFAHRQIIA